MLNSTCLRELFTTNFSRYSVLGYLYSYQGQYQEAEQYYKRAIAIAVGDWTAIEF
ncbi:MAG: tetratricopeptide repeat protein [Cyanobacteria bacterium J06592_8]